MKPTLIIRLVWLVALLIGAFGMMCGVCLLPSASWPWPVGFVLVGMILMYASAGGLWESRKWK